MPASETATTTRSRRALLAGIAGGFGAWAVAALERATPAEAASGDPIRAGRTTAAGSTNTTLTASTTGATLRATQAGTGVALRGESAGGNGAYLRAAKSGANGLYARNAATSTGSGAAVLADGGKNAALRARTSGDYAYAIEAKHASTNPESSAIYAEIPSGTAVFGAATSHSGTNYGIYAYANGSTGYGVAGYGASNDGQSVGVLGSTVSLDGSGVRGENSGGGTAVLGTSAGIGVAGTSTGTHGVYGSTQHGSSAGVSGQTNAGYGVHGYSYSGIGVIAATGIGLAGVFNGNVQVNGSLSKSGGSFRIDHPLAPGRKYLQHSFVESPDMKNVYDGVVRADGRGRATVELPDWFAALNRDVRYALTALDGPMPDLHVSRRMEDNRFAIAGAAPNGEVSWQVTGIRHDAWADAHRIEVEVDKDDDERGRFIHPELFGEPESRAVGFDRRPSLAVER